MSRRIINPHRSIPPMELMSVDPAVTMGTPKSDLGSLRGISELVLFDEVIKAQGDVSKLRRLSFEVAATFPILGGPGCIERYLFPSGPFLEGVHRLRDYQSVMHVVGKGLYLANSVDKLVGDVFTPEYVHKAQRLFTKDQMTDGLGYNDSARNAIRLIGFLRDEKRVGCLLEVFKERIRRYKSMKEFPWFIDSDYAILDALDAVHFTEQRALTDAIKGLEMISQTGEVSELALSRLTDVVKSLTERKPGPLEQDALVGEFMSFRATSDPNSFAWYKRSVGREKGGGQTRSMKPILRDLPRREDPLITWKAAICLCQTP